MRTKDNFPLVVPWIVAAILLPSFATASPSQHVRSRTLQTTTLSCSSLSGADASSSTHTLSGSVTIDISPNLCTLVQVTNSGFIKPVARSYDGNAWEASAGDYTGLTFSCTANACTTSLPSDTRTYQLTSFTRPSYTSNDETARFLEQATFGPTRQDIQAFSNPAQWIQQQVALPLTSHRSEYRRRTNAQFEVPSILGGITHPCRAGSIFRRHAFTEKDVQKFMTIRTLTSNPAQRELIVDGEVRTVVNGPIMSEESVEGGNVEFTDGAYPICFSFSVRGGNLELFHPSFGCASVSFGGSRINPPITLTTSPANLVMLNGASRPIDAQLIPQNQHVILTRNLTENVCSSLGSNQITTVFGILNGQFWIHDPRFNTLDNTLESPLPDGGGVAAAVTPSNSEDLGLRPTCANVIRTFLNQDRCFMSTDPNACAYTTGVGGQTAEFFTPLNESVLRAAFTSSRRYVYAIDGLRIQDDLTVPPTCLNNARSRWMRQSSCGSNPNAPTVTPSTQNVFRQMFARAAEDEVGVPMLRDIFFPDEFLCASVDMGRKGFEIRDNNGVCWLNVHPNHLDVHDFTPWIDNHPGNTATRNPIREVAERGGVRLMFPASHEMPRWQLNRGNFQLLGRLGDSFDYLSIPQLRSPGLDTVVGYVAPVGDTPRSEVGSMVCGSPNEVSNDLTLGGLQTLGAYDSRTSQFVTTSDITFVHQKRVVWTEIALRARDQLRQRVAWALAQILVINQQSIPGSILLTEIFVTYYDIFVRNAFGSYRDVLKEVSFSPAMADMLTYYGSRSTAFVWENEGNLEFADENYAREVMQLFTIGLVRLNMNGTEVTDGSGVPLRVYSNDDIVEYARVWTGFESQAARGNLEFAARANQVDPMRIAEEFRDWLPKMGLDRQYVGDGYPLCIDLPERHFLRRGATYRLLGSSPSPEVQQDPSIWASNSNTLRFVLQPNGSNSLFAQLCGSTNAANCNNAATVTLSQSLMCSGQECNVDTVRVVQVGNIFYEYIRPPCVHQAFFSNGLLLGRTLNGERNVCADRRYESASPACCNQETGVEGLSLQYFGERTRFSTANSRCGQTLCSRNFGPNCNDEEPEVGQRCLDNNFYWTADSCTTRVKIDRIGNVGIVHSAANVADTTFERVVQEDTRTYFRVDWTGDFNSILSRCASISTCARTRDGMCVCDVSVTDQAAFTQAPSRSQVLSLKTGAFDPQFLGGYSSSTNNNVTTYTASGGLGSMNTIFQVTDDNGMTQLRKNMRSVANVVGTGVSFRNPVHFVHLADPEIRDQHYETDAALDHYFYHANMAPFLAIRLAQRFGISNPSPRYVQEIATAFKTGRYVSNGVTFGSNTYGDLGATIACVLLDREARSTVLDSDPSHGSLREPLIKVLSLMRSMEFQLFGTSPYVDFGTTIGQRIGQMAHEIPSVFSFFLPEHRPSGRVAQACLTAPEGQVLSSPRIIAVLNGMFALIKYGLGGGCWGGFGGFGPFDEIEAELCEGKRVGNYDGNAGRLTFAPSNAGSSQDVVNELATLMTAGRLGAESRLAVQQVFSAAGNPTIGLIRAQQAIVSSPEFHATNIVRRSGQQRPTPTPRPPSQRPYKAVVYVLLDGGMDSFNMLVPHTCAQRNVNGMTLREQYNAERTTIAMTDEERLRIINAKSQPCSQFAIHQNLGLVERLYNERDLAFFANVGVLNRPVTRENFGERTVTQLFAHNAMQEEAQRIDPFTTSPGSGVLGRMCDVLNTNGFNAQPITIEESSAATVGVPGRAVDPLVVSSQGIETFNARPSGETFNPRPILDGLNNATQLQSSLYGETWSERVQKALIDNEALLNAVRNTQLTQQFPSESNSQKLRAIATLMAAQRERGTDRDVFFVRLGSWDHHQGLRSSLAQEFTALDSSLTHFTNEIRAQGLWNNMTLVLTSDFGRTLTANSGNGSDHAWGGNYFITGGSVQGGKIHGDFPSDITEAGPLNIGRGRLIPTLSWESILNGVVQWMGVESESDLDYCLPNRNQTGTRLFTQRELFNNVPPAAPPASSPPTGFNICFPGDSVVDVYGKGAVKMKDVKINDMVLSGNGAYSKVYAFAHKLDDAEAEFVEIRTNNDHAIELSRDHMVKIDEGKFVPAGSVREGTLLHLGSGEKAVASQIGMVKRSSGVYAPFTMSGSIVVNGIVASNYVTLQSNKSDLTIGGVQLISYQWLMHKYQTPHRGMCLVFDCESEEYGDEGIAVWAKLPYEIWKWLIGQGDIMQLVFLTPFVLLLALFWVGEIVFGYPILVGCLVWSTVYARKLVR